MAGIHQLSALLTCSARALQFHLNTTQMYPSSKNAWATWTSTHSQCLHCSHFSRAKACTGFGKFRCRGGGTWKPVASGLHLCSAGLLPPPHPPSFRFCFLSPLSCVNASVPAALRGRRHRSRENISMYADANMAPAVEPTVEHTSNL